MAHNQELRCKTLSVVRVVTGRAEALEQAAVQQDALRQQLAEAQESALVAEADRDELQRSADAAAATHAAMAQLRETDAQLQR